MRALLAAAVALAAAPSAHALPRSEADRPDEVSGPQVHAIYVLPADGADRALDTSGAVEQSVLGWNDWLARESETAASASTATPVSST